LLAVIAFFFFRRTIVGVPAFFFSHPEPTLVFPFSAWRFFLLGRSRGPSAGRAMCSPWQPPCSFGSLDLPSDRALRLSSFFIFFPYFFPVISTELLDRLVKRIDAPLELAIFLLSSLAQYSCFLVVSGRVPFFPFLEVFFFPFRRDVATFVRRCLVI